MRGDPRKKLSPFIRADLGFIFDHLVVFFLTMSWGASVYLFTLCTLSTEK